MRPAILRSAVCVLFVSLLAGGPPASAWDGVSHAVVKVWNTAVPIPPSLSLGLTPGESVEDPAGLTDHGTSFPTIVTVYARSSHPGGLSGVSYWNPEGNVFAWYGKTFGGLPAAQMPPPPPSSGFPGGVDINRGGGPVLAGGPFGTSFGPGDVWIGGAQNEPLIVQMAGSDPLTGAGRFRSYGTNNPLLPPSGQAFGVQVDEATGHVFVAQTFERRISRVNPPTAIVTMWDMGTCNGSTCGSPVYVTVDTSGRPYATTVGSTFGDGVVRVNRGADGVLGLNPLTGVSDDTISLWALPSQPAYRIPPLFLTNPEENPNGLITADADGNVWISESGAHKVARLNPATNQICEYTTSGMRNPQQITTTGSGSSLQVFFTEGEGNSVSVLTQGEADLAPFPDRACVSVTPLTFPTRVVDVTTQTFDELVLPLRTAIVPTVHHVASVGGSGIARFSPMPNPLLSVDGDPIGDAGNGFPSGMTGVYGVNRVAGAYLDLQNGNKHFQVESRLITAPPPSPPGGLPGRMTGGGRLATADGTKVTYGLVLRCAADQQGKDALQVNWSEGNRFHLTRVNAASCSDDPSISPDPPPASFDTHSGRGTGRYNGVDGATAEWTFTDAGEPGNDDTVRLVIRNASGTVVLVVSGRLTRGNNQAHDAR